jgi:hypothetical protein
MVISQADMCDPGWSELMLAMARRSVSCSRSSARSTLQDSTRYCSSALASAALHHHMSQIGIGRTTGPLRLPRFGAHVSDLLSKIDEPGNGHEQRAPNAPMHTVS